MRTIEIYQHETNKKYKICFMKEGNVMRMIESYMPVVDKEMIINWIEKELVPPYSYA